MKVLLSDDYINRGTEKPSFTIICECGRLRRFQFSKEGFDIYPCSGCFTSGYTNIKQKEN